METRKVILAFTGASGAGYGVELLKGLNEKRPGGLKVYVIYNDTSLSILKSETGKGLNYLKELSDEIIHSGEMNHPFASGSNHFHEMVICPCTTSTTSKIHSGISDNLTTRLACVALKERRKLILVIRETPLSTPVLRSMFELSSWGVVIMPASPPFYNLNSESICDLQRSFAGRVMDALGLINDLTKRYFPDEK